MGFRCGIIGLPNVGKSTLFNALTSSSQAAAANYPFCTVEPNIGCVPVPDKQLEIVARIAGSKSVIPTVLDVLDIAGLVRGASDGEGLGNKFLGQIREVEALLHVVRCFEDEQIAHVEGAIDPIRDIELVETELVLADMESLERQKIRVQKQIKTGDKEAKELQPIIENALTTLHQGKPLRTLFATKEEQNLIKSLNLLTTKPVLFICNVGEDCAHSGNELSKQVMTYSSNDSAGVVVVSVAIEAEIAALETSEERRDFLCDLGMESAGLERVLCAGQKLLGLLRFLTAGPKESRAWTLKAGSTARDAAGKIHSDMAKGFICAETISFEDFVEYNGEAGAKVAGKVRQEGGDYIVAEADVILFRFNV